MFAWARDSEHRVNRGPRNVGVDLVVRTRRRTVSFTDHLEAVMKVEEVFSEIEDLNSFPYENDWFAPSVVNLKTRSSTMVSVRQQPMKTRLKPINFVAIEPACMLTVKIWSVTLVWQKIILFLPRKKCWSNRNERSFWQKYCRNNFLRLRVSYLNLNSNERGCLVFNLSVAEQWQSV